MGARTLAEAVIMQSICDLWNPHEKEESIKFFKGQWFDRYASVAGMVQSEKDRLIGMLGVGTGPCMASKHKDRRGVAA
ncbi:MAG: hypothetical protein EPN22_07070 [Nitrospirae bacterium]|nr:MAG: hypothetical protein EPN22_07070 [Nitrospirota bacterium]